MLIENSDVSQGALTGKTAILTGGGGGIGFEVARSLTWLGANVIIAEIDAGKGKTAADTINREAGCGRADFYQINLSDETQIDMLVRYAKEKYGFVDVLLNNATITQMGAVENVPVSAWDKSYAVNLRAPLLLTQKLLPDMKARNSGTIVFVSSSGAAPYMGAYEVFKTAQVELCNTLAGELEGTNIYALTIGPGLVKTDTAMKSIETIAALMGISTDEFYSMNEAHILSAEEAGAGFALAVAFAEKYNGQEISSIQVLVESGAYNAPGDIKTLDTKNLDDLKRLISEAVETYDKQYDGWLQRNVFERQWILRDFKKTVGYPAEQFKAEFHKILSIAEGGSFNELPSFKGHFEKLTEYYLRQHKLMQSFEKDPEKLKENNKIIEDWIKNLQKICDML